MLAMTKADQCFVDSTLVYVDADAQNQTYITENGEKLTSLKLFHRTRHLLLPQCYPRCGTNLLNRE